MRKVTCARSWGIEQMGVDEVAANDPQKKGPGNEPVSWMLDSRK